jgi:hypothetical protein
LEEFENNRKMVVSIKDFLIGAKNKIHLMSSDGKYHNGKKYISPSGFVFNGKIIKHMLVSPEYREFAVFLDCTPIRGIHFSDIYASVDTLSTEDVEDFLQGDFDYWEEIIRCYISADKILDEHIRQYRLERLVQHSEIYEDDYDFPQQKVKDLQKIRNIVANTTLNKITKQLVLAEREDRVPAFNFPRDEKRGYALESYRPKGGNNLHFCQMCQRPFPQKYIEIRALEHEPDYAWKYMQLCLCVTCSKDYRYLRENENTFRTFVSEILAADPDDYEPIIIPIANDEIHFTATHLAYIQEILRRHRTLKIN